MFKEIEKEAQNKTLDVPFLREFLRFEKVENNTQESLLAIVD